MPATTQESAGQRWPGPPQGKGEGRPLSPHPRQEEDGNCKGGVRMGKSLVPLKERRTENLLSSPPLAPGQS